MAIRAVKFGGREVYVGALCDIASVDVISPFGILVPAASQEELDELLGMASRILGLGCREFCCVGPQAEALHDQLDSVLEDAGLLDVATTWHEDAVEACEYFLYAAGGQRLVLYALISRHPELLDAMVLAAQAD